MIDNRIWTHAPDFATLRPANRIPIGVFMTQKKKNHPILPIESMDVRLIISNPRVLVRLAYCNIYTLAEARRASVSGIRAILRHAEFDPDTIEDTIKRIFSTDYSRMIRWETSGYPPMPLIRPQKDV